MGTPQYGVQRDIANSRVSVNYAGTRRLTVDGTGVAVTGTLSTSTTLTVTAGGMVITSGVLSVDDTTESSSAITGSIHTDGGMGVAKNLFLGLTVETSDGVGADGEQFTSGGAAAVCDWASAASQRQMKHVGEERTDAAEVLETMVGTPVYDFQYKHKDEEDYRIASTGDVETVYTGIMADEAPWAMHHGGRILNPISTFGNTVLAIKALNDRLEALEG